VPWRDPRLLRRSLLHNLRPLPDGRWTWKYDPKLIAWADLDDMRLAMHRLWDAVAKITCPTLVVRGARSAIFLDDDAAALARALPDGRWRRIDAAGHNVQGDNPKGLAEAIVEFLSG
jgi:pimeloyl-ACP methyl ester carboxylesterase